MDIETLRDRYLKFFELEGHAIIPSASLLPENDPTTLFTGSGMQPIIPFLLGAPHPAVKRLVDAQKCFRAEDMDEVGDNRHTTFFEMLGNWSFGDYFKREQLSWFFSFLTDNLGISPERLYVTVFAGDQTLNLPKDTDSVLIWKELFKSKGIIANDVHLGSLEEASRSGMQGGRIFYYDARKNWWSRSGAPHAMPSGEPGGPDSEMFYEFTAIKHDPRFGAECHPNCDCGRFLEIGNSVFMEYVKSADGSFKSLPQKNVDFGGGLERIGAALLNSPDIFAVDVLKRAVEKLERISKRSYKASTEEEKRPFRIIADHLRAATFMIAAGVEPSNKDRGYVVRRLVRRALFNARALQIEGTAWINEVVDVYIQSYGRFYPEIDDGQEEVVKHLLLEAEKFLKTLEAGVRQFTQVATKGVLQAEDIFNLYQSYGFPEELSIELARKQGLTVDTTELATHRDKHRELSRNTSEKKFKGGLADTSDMSIKYHTATHLLNQALRQVLGNHVYQKGSNIAPERLRFDFPNDTKLTSEQIVEVERIVNEKIAEALPVEKTTMPYAEAQKQGVVGVFGERYPEIVSVYRIGFLEKGFFSQEICGGPHVNNTSELGGNFKISKEEGISRGVRRIRAVLG